MKNRVVSKKELEESGLSLRDFLNKERGLTRKAPEGTKAGEYKPRRSPEAMTATVKPGTNVNYENTDTSDMSMKRGGKVKGYAKGGVTRADGCVTKGHTKGKMV
jgi:hypothetical protein